MCDQNPELIIVVRDMQSQDVINLMLLTILHMREQSNYEISELTRKPQMFPFRYAVSLEWLHNSSYYSLNHYGGKMTVAKADRTALI